MVSLVTVRAYILVFLLLLSITAGIAVVLADRFRRPAASGLALAGGFLPSLVLGIILFEPMASGLEFLGWIWYVGSFPMFLGAYLLFRFGRLPKSSGIAVGTSLLGTVAGLATAGTIFPLFWWFR